MMCCIEAHDLCQQPIIENSSKSDMSVCRDHFFANLTFQIVIGLGRKPSLLFEVVVDERSGGFEQCGGALNLFHSVLWFTFSKKMCFRQKKDNGIGQHFPAWRWRRQEKHLNQSIFKHDTQWGPASLLVALVQVLVQVANSTLHEKSEQRRPATRK